AGLARQELPELAADVADRHITALGKTGALHEFLYVDPEGRVRHPLLPMTVDAPADEILAGTNDPETDQAWTVSFVLRTLLGRETEPSRSTGWRAELTREVLVEAPEM